MQAFVFTDKALARRAGQFVWLSIDTEKASNASFTRKFPVEGLPTFFILDAATETATLRWLGGATVPQMQKLLDDGLRTVSHPKGSVEQTLARADRLFGEGKNAEAAKAYREALAAAPAGWPRYGRSLESLLYTLDATKDREGCAVAARDAFSRLKNTPSAANVAASGLSCALGIPPENPARRALVEALRADALSVVAARRRDVAADDMSSLYQTLEQDREEAKDLEGRRRVLDQHAAFLEERARAARTPSERAVFDSHRVGAYMDLGQPERAVPMLEQSEKDFPGDYNPPARLAVIWNVMKKPDEAAAASDRALEKAYGPRRIGILRVRSDIERARGDAAASRRYLEEALRAAEGLPEGQRSDRMIASLKKKLESSP
ncbi:MAG: thiol reductase thioredoxin [Acidobacteriota bacterium]